MALLVFLRNSNNRQTTVGLLSKLNYDFSKDLKAQIGIDYRSARIYHVKTIRDLLAEITLLLQTVNLNQIMDKVGLVTRLIIILQTM